MNAGKDAARKSQRQLQAPPTWTRKTYERPVARRRPSGQKRSSVTSNRPRRWGGKYSVRSDGAAHAPPRRTSGGRRRRAGPPPKGAGDPPPAKPPPAARGGGPPRGGGAGGPPPPPPPPPRVSRCWGGAPPSPPPSPPLPP